MSSTEESMQWWQQACVYQVYPRSFADGDGDGVGDLRGLRRRLPYLASLGVDALWICPWYPSPLRDGGYDVTDHMSVHPQLGTVDDVRSLLDAAHMAGLRVIVDVVPNHTSNDHPWFRNALAAGPQGDARDRYHFRRGRGPGGGSPPNDWQSVFGGPAWTAVDNGWWYLHLFDSSQPDLNWQHPQVRARFDDVLRHWMGLGVDGFRIDVANGLAKHPDYPDAGEPVDLLSLSPGHGHPHWDRPEVHEIARRWRRVVADVDRPVLLLAEAWVGADLLGDYLRPGEYHQAFNFDFLFVSWEAAQFRAVVERGLDATAGTPAAPTWALSNHDVMRHATRFGLPVGLDPSTWVVSGPRDQLDEELGRRRARAASLFTLALPGCTFLYQGEELGLPEVWDLPENVLRDPTWVRSGHTDRGRDGCRVPLPWTSDGPSHGFSDSPGWLPQPERFGPLAAASQALDPTSTLAMYRRALVVRNALLRADVADFDWLDAGDDVLAFRRGSLVCVTNFGTTDAPWPTGLPLVASAPVTRDGTLPANATMWLLDT
jgi:alpha-glucosidase